MDKKFVFPLFTPLLKIVFRNTVLQPAICHPPSAKKCGGLAECGGRPLHFFIRCLCQDFKFLSLWYRIQDARYRMNDTISALEVSPTSKGYKER